MNYDLSVTIRLCKANYVSCRPNTILSVIGENAFYRSPDFEPMRLSEIYHSQAMKERAVLASKTSPEQE